MEASLKTKCSEGMRHGVCGLLGSWTPMLCAQRERRGRVDHEAHTCSGEGPLAKRRMAPSPPISSGR